MAKKPQSTSRSRVRIFFVDADLAPGDMQELTAALTNAIRPTHLIQAGPHAKLIGPSAEAGQVGGAADQAELVELEDAPERDGDQESAPRPSRKPRSYRSPTVVDDLDPTGGGEKSFEEFANEKGPPTEDVQRYLVAAYWLAEYAALPTITTDHVYTCYRMANWSFGVQDPGAPFRYLKRKGFGATADGQFTLNHVGRARVDKMDRGSGG